MPQKQPTETLREVFLTQAQYDACCRLRDMQAGRDAWFSAAAIKTNGATMSALAKLGLVVMLGPVHSHHENFEIRYYQMARPPKDLFISLKVKVR